MTKIALTISENYCHTWDLFCGVREFLQNARDATKTGCTFDAVYDAELNTLRIKTIGATLEHSTLLLGESSKRGRLDMLGHQGEGYKIGSLVLCRLGKGVKIRTGEELWVPMIEFSKKFGTNALHFDISKGRKHVNEVAVEITGITQPEWDGMKNKFLFVSDMEIPMHSTAAGDVLMESAGDIYVDGIWVCNIEKIRHGYNFKPADAKLDRDRRLMESWTIKNLIVKIWELLYINPSRKYCDMIDDMLAQNIDDVEHFRYDWAVGMQTRALVANRFKEKFGGQAVAVSNQSQVRELQFYGREGVIVDAEPLRSILESQLGTVESVQRSLASEIAAEHTSLELDPRESKNFMMALEFVSKALNRTGANITKDVTIVKFRSPSVMGMRKNNKIYLSRTTLASFNEALKTLVEEVAHEVGGDGTHDHVEMIHKIYADGVVHLMQSNVIEGQSV